MFENISRAAETLATNVSLSRRGFLGQLARGALVAVVAVGGVLGTSGKAQALTSYNFALLKYPKNRWCVTRCTNNCLAENGNTAINKNDCFVFCASQVCSRY